MNGLDLFSGIGGITKALEGYVIPVAYCENDKYAQAVLLSRMSTGDLPEAPIWDDVRTLDGQELPAIDIIYGGFPCQDISVAGRGAGLAGERSGLYFEIARIVSEIRPAFVFLENVPNIRTTGADIVVGTLASIGYDCRWGVLSAADVGANHIRERWWLLANAKSEQERIPGQPRQYESLASDSPSGRRRQEHSDAGRSSERAIATKERRGFANSAWWKTEPKISRVDDGTVYRMDRTRCVGNAVVPAQAREAFERLLGLK